MFNQWLFDVMSTLFTFSFLLILIRWIGKTQITQATHFTWVAGACMGNLGANMLSTNSVKGIFNNAIELVLFSALTVLASFISLKSPRFRSMASGTPMILINHGDILYDNLKKSKVNKDLLEQMLREQGHFDYHEIKWAILEPTGSLSILPLGDDSTDKQNHSRQNPLSKKRKKNQPIK